MGLAYHELYASDGLANWAVYDRIFLGVVNATYAAGATATVAVTWTEGVPLANYGVLVALPELGVGWATASTAKSFTLNVSALGGVLTGGTAKCIIIA